CILGRAAAIVSNPSISSHRKMEKLRANNVLLFIFLLLVLPSQGEILFECDTLQECRDSVWKTFGLSESKEACQRLCSQAQGCRWYTYLPHSKICIALKECTRFRECKDCITSQVECPHCFQRGRCEGMGIRILRVNSAHQCLQSCADEEEACRSFSYINGLCGLYKNCTLIQGESCPNCVVGTMRHCKYGRELPTGFRDRQFSTKILISGGMSKQGDAKPEILDLENPNFKCILEEPQKRNKHIRTTLLNESYPLLCGYGINFFKNGCQLYLDNGEVKYIPDVFIGVIHGFGESFVPGHGWWLSTAKGESEILRLPHVKTIPGPRLPSDLELHCMVQINDFETMIIGGLRLHSPNSAKTWIFNWSDMAWRFGPDLIQGRRSHVCGLYKNKYVVVGGGNVAGKHKHTNTTEILDLSKLTSGWQKGPTLPNRVANAAMVQINDFNLIIVGGIDFKKEQDPQIGALYQFQLDGWIRLTSRLQIPRSHHSATWIPDTAAQSCMKNMNNYI
ncbi:Uncharacterized protein FKW44_008235, partial [Caligus rogercresseyi]